MGNKTIYVKDEALWERAKELAGKQGLSRLVAEALADFVKRREAADRGLHPHEVEIHSPYLNEVEPIKFWGKRVAVGYMKRRDSRDAIAEVFETRARKLLLVLRDDVSREAYEYRIFETLDQLVRDPRFQEMSQADRDDFEESISRAVGDNWATVID